jgi:hypothetical protein
MPAGRTRAFVHLRDSDQLHSEYATPSQRDTAGQRQRRQQPADVALTGTGIVNMTVTPTSYGFGSVKDGTKAVKVIVVHNYQKIPVSLSEGFSGSNTGDFSVTGGTCTSTLAAASACTLIVTYAPTATGTESATMTVTDSPDSLGPYTVSFTSSADVPESLLATKIVFGNVYQTASKTLSIATLTNRANVPITLGGASIGGANAGDFSIAGGTCGGGLLPSSSCSYVYNLEAQHRDS